MPNVVEVGSRLLPKVSAWRAASILDVVGVVIIAFPRTSNGFPKLSCPAIGDSEKNCCCITGSTDAATEFVDSATFLSTFNAIQSLMHMIHTR